MSSLSCSESVKKKTIIMSINKKKLSFYKFGNIYFKVNKFIMMRYN